jgi:predicted nucleotidyltransferase component of viral defense system
MTPKKNAAASVRQRLLNSSKQTGEDFQLLITRYAIERLLYRLSTSDHATSFVLKGAMLFALWTGEMHRPTRDLDFLGFGENSDERLTSVFTTLCSIAAPDDGLVFHIPTMSVEPIREEDEYGGRRVTVEVSLGQAKIKLQVDVGFGDAITPAAELVEYPTILGMDAPRLRAYPKETVIAEKVEAMVKLGQGNSRMKDFYDLLVLSRTFTFEGVNVRAAMAATFQRRGTTVPAGTPVGLSDMFAQDDSKKKQWKSFVRRSGLEKQVGELREVLTELTAFVLPPLLAAATLTDKFDKRWHPGGPWENRSSRSR